MKKGRVAINQLTYQFEVPATDFRKEAYRKLLSNKKVKNFILREFKRENNRNVYNGYITSQRPVLITTFKMWVNCADNQIWPVYPSPEFLESQRNNPNIVYFKYNPCFIWFQIMYFYAIINLIYSEVFISLLYNFL